MFPSTRTVNGGFEADENEVIFTEQLRAIFVDESKRPKEMENLQILKFLLC